MESVRYFGVLWHTEEIRIARAELQEDGREFCNWIGTFPKLDTPIGDLIRHFEGMEIAVDLLYDVFKDREIAIVYAPLFFSWVVRGFVPGRWTIDRGTIQAFVSVAQYSEAEAGESALRAEMGVSCG
jgi:hypothetical protein